MFVQIIEVFCNKSFHVYKMEADPNACTFHNGGSLGQDVRSLDMVEL